jgi:threonine dehydratase
MALVVGLDGCRAGWIAVATSDWMEFDIAVFASIHAALEAFKEAAIIGIDMPMGLPERISGSGRMAEQAVRGRLGARQSSVFSIPAREAIYAVTPQPEGMATLKAAHQTASGRARSLSDPPRGVAFQTFNLFPKIREIDAVLAGSAHWRERLREVHPEAAFWRMNGKKPLAQPKKIKGRVHPDGMTERRALLRAEALPEALLATEAPKGAALDDLVDAMAVLVAARHISAGRGAPNPDPFERDRHGTPIAIWLWE